MSNEQKLEQTRNALHTAFAIIVNAENCLGNGDRDSKLAEQWHEAAQRFIQDYNANLDVYTGYQVRYHNPLILGYGFSFHINQLGEIMSNTFWI